MRVAEAQDNAEEVCVQRSRSVRSSEDVAEYVPRTSVAVARHVRCPRWQDRSDDRGTIIVAQNFCGLLLLRGAVNNL